MNKQSVIRYDRLAGNRLRKELRPKATPQQRGLAPHTPEVGRQHPRGDTASQAELQHGARSPASVGESLWPSSRTYRPKKSRKLAGSHTKSPEKKRSRPALTSRYREEKYQDH
ncbi:hypothetical protein E2C01_019706 [Portunus trituberculatus]|uniref:Uncharacterized protein n=1 Tax=Portunus trituberculatus TaxID=210409 RepID=A0A5B7DZE2_PORTR|nr:hypothetical protein [Portunus trituberculatus]